MVKFLQYVAAALREVEWSGISTLFALAIGAPPLKRKIKIKSIIT